jgi:O26-antigen biosynthesis N-acetyl-L-fucosamine transferase
MRTLILAVRYLPGHDSTAKLVYDLAVELNRQGHDTTVLAPSHKITEKVQVSVEDGLRIIRVKTKQMEGAARPLRAIREFCLSALIWRRTRQFLSTIKMDLIVFFSPTIFFGSLVRQLKSLWHCPAYLVVRDIFPQWALDAGVLRPGIAYQLFRRKEVEQYDIADTIAVQCPGDLSYFERSLPDKRYKVKVLYNWTTARKPEIVRTNVRAELGLQQKVVFFYGGNLGVAQDVDNIVRLAAKLASQQGIFFLLVGYGTEAIRLQKSVIELGLRNIRLLPSVEQRAYLSMVSEFDVGLVTLDRRLSTNNIPGKLLGYMQCAMPVLASVNPGNDMFQLLEQSEAGLCVVNGQDEEFCGAALRLASDSELRSRMGRNARVLLEQSFSVEAAVREILSTTTMAAPKLARAGEAVWMSDASLDNPHR